MEAGDEPWWAGVAPGCRQMTCSRFDDLAIRGADIFLSSLALILLSPAMVVIAAAIRLYDGQPAIFCQRRIGQGTGPFTIYKFRTMRVAARGGGTGGLSHRTQRADPRITPVGRFLRPCHLDELPQLFNVLAGQMSLVGVRPDTPVQIRDYSPEHWQSRHLYRPGITGPGQIAVGEFTLEDRPKLERIWLEGRSFSLYMRVLWLTFAKVWARSSN